MDPAAAARIAELEATVAELTARLAKRNHYNLESLRAYDKAHPERASERSKRSKERNREAYNARRRELRRLKKSGEPDASDAPHLPPAVGLGEPAASDAPHLKPPA